MVAGAGWRHPRLGVVFLALLLGLMFLAKRVGTDDDFRSIKPSAYNVLTISLAAIVGIPV